MSLALFQTLGSTALVALFSYFARFCFSLSKATPGPCSRAAMASFSPSKASYFILSGLYSRTFETVSKISVEGVIRYRYCTLGYFSMTRAISRKPSGTSSFNEGFFLPSITDRSERLIMSITISFWSIVYSKHRKIAASGSICITKAPSMEYFPSYLLTSKAPGTVPDA